MGSTAWNADGDVPVQYNIPFGAVRKAALHCLGSVRKVVKLTLGGIVFDIGKQAAEGLVVVGNGYSSVTFFLPDGKEPMTEKDGESKSVYDYLEMLGSTDYSVVTAWDYFAGFVGETVRSVAENSDTEIGPLAYSLYQNASESSTHRELFGTADFSSVTTARAFFAVLLGGLDEASLAEAKSSPLHEWMEGDGAVAILLKLTLAENNKPTFPMYIGRK